MAASGFASLPSDPVRITAKPAARLLIPPGQYFTRKLNVGVAAAANDGGTRAEAGGPVRTQVACKAAVAAMCASITARPVPLGPRR